MYARVSTIVGNPGKLDEAVRHLEQAISIGTEKGWNGGYALVNKEAGKMMTITLWDTREDLEASGAVADKIRDQAAGIAEASTPAVEVYEVALRP